MEAQHGRRRHRVRISPASLLSTSTTDNAPLDDPRSMTSSRDRAAGGWVTISRHANQRLYALARSCWSHAPARHAAKWMLDLAGSAKLKKAFHRRFRLFFRKSNACQGELPATFSLGEYRPGRVKTVYHGGSEVKCEHSFEIQSNAKFAVFIIWRHHPVRKMVRHR